MERTRQGGAKRLSVPKWSTVNRKHVGVDYIMPPKAEEYLCAIPYSRWDLSRTCELGVVTYQGTKVKKGILQIHAGHPLVWPHDCYYRPEGLHLE